MSNLIPTVAGQSAYNYMKIPSIRLQVRWLYGLGFRLGEKKISTMQELVRLKQIENRMRKYIRGLDEYPASFYIKKHFHYTYIKRGKNNACEYNTADSQG